MVLFLSLTLSNILTRKTQETQNCKSLRPCSRLDSQLSTINLHTDLTNLTKASRFALASVRMANASATSVLRVLRVLCVRQINRRMAAIASPHAKCFYPLTQIFDSHAESQKAQSLALRCQMNSIHGHLRLIYGHSC